MGDLNEAQSLALTHFLVENDRLDGAAEWRTFKLNAIAAHPELAQVILELEEPGQRQSVLQRPWTDEELSHAPSVTHEDISEMVDVLQGFGIRMNQPEG